MSQLDRIEAKIDRVRAARNWQTIVYLSLFAILGGWNVWCQSDRIVTAAQIEAVMMLIKKQDATILELRRIIAMQREDPKAFPRLTEQFKAIEDYEHARADRDRGNQKRTVGR